MSNKYKNSRNVPTIVLIKRLNVLADCIANGGNFSSEFDMRVPVELDRDADVVLSEAADRLEDCNCHCHED